MKQALVVLVALGLADGCATPLAPPPTIEQTVISLRPNEYVVPDGIINSAWDYAHQATGNGYDWISQRALSVLEEPFSGKSIRRYFDSAMIARGYSHNEAQRWREVLSTHGNIIVPHSAVSDPKTKLAIQYQRARHMKLSDKQTDLIYEAYQLVVREGHLDPNYDPNEFLPSWCIGTLSPKVVIRIQTGLCSAYDTLEQVKKETTVR